jgi:AraC family transcriptional regulator, ethanolamine operon transcriptional activator
MSRLIFRDFDEFADSIDGIAGRFVPTARSTAEWWVDAVPAGVLSLQQIQIGGSATFAGDGAIGSFTLGIPMTKPQSIRIDGQRLDTNSFIVLKQNQPFTFAGHDVTRWAGVTLPVDHPGLGQELLDKLHASDGACTRTDPLRLEQLRWLIGRICCGTPTINLSDPAAAKMAEQEISAVAVRALERSLRLQLRPIGRPHLSRERVIARALDLIRAHEGQPLFTSDLCRAAGVSERTLRNTFNEYFGVGPIRLLKMRQLREIRAALLAADPAHETVASIAGRFGVWDFSLFARNYKRLFGESPSQTLRTPAGSSEHADDTSWLAYAVRKFADDLLYGVPRSLSASAVPLHTGSNEQ